MKVVIVEDEFVVREDIATELERSGYDIVATYDNAERACEGILELCPDLLLVDIRLTGKMDGIEMATRVLQSIRVPLIYITANSDAATFERARKTRPHAFLVKPFSTANLLASVDLALLNFSGNSLPERIERSAPAISDVAPFLIHHALFIRCNGRYRKVKIGDIQFVEASGSYVHLQTTDERFTLAQNLSQFQKKAAMPGLIRIHRSFMVNIERVESFEDSHVYVGNRRLPMSDQYKAEFHAQIRLL